MDKNDKINILRILTEKDNTIKYELSNIPYLLGTQTVSLDQEYDTNTIYFTRVNVGSGSSKYNKNKNDIEIFIKKIISGDKKKIDVYMFANKIGITLKIKDSYSYDFLSDDNNLLNSLYDYNLLNLLNSSDLNKKNTILDNMIKNLKQNKSIIFNSRGNNYEYQISNVYLNN